jgi:hypothetical protein
MGHADYYLAETGNDDLVGETLEEEWGHGQGSVKIRDTEI